MNWEEPEGATPLSPDELNGLRVGFVRTRSDLNDLETSAIADALRLYSKRNLKPETILDDLFLRKLHLAMFGKVWSWAGRYRTKDLNIGIDSKDVAIEVRVLTQNTLTQLEPVTSAEAIDRVACEFHHRLVAIHPFVNGNGRHARFATDLLLKSLDCAEFDWGASDLQSVSDVRRNYIQALQAADSGNMELLLKFVRSGRGATYQ